MCRMNFLSVCATGAGGEWIDADDEELERAERDLAAQYQMSVDDALAAARCSSLTLGSVMVLPQYSHVPKVLSGESSISPPHILHLMIAKLIFYTQNLHSLQFNIYEIYENDCTFDGTVFSTISGFNLNATVLLYT